MSYVVGGCRRRVAGEQARVSEGLLKARIILFSPFLKMSVLRLPQSPLKVLQPSAKANQNLMKPQILTNCLPDSTDENQEVCIYSLFSVLVKIEKSFEILIFIFCRIFSVQFQKTSS